MILTPIITLNSNRLLMSFVIVASAHTTHFSSSHHPHQSLYQSIPLSHPRRALFAHSSVTIETLQHIAEGVVDGVQHILHPTPTRQPEDNMAGEDTPEVGDKGMFIYQFSISIRDYHSVAPFRTLYPSLPHLSFDAPIPFSPYAVNALSHGLHQLTPFSHSLLAVRWLPPKRRTCREENRRRDRHQLQAR